MLLKDDILIEKSQCFFDTLKVEGKPLRKFVSNIKKVTKAFTLIEK